jgi:hypothetical protein
MIRIPTEKFFKLMSYAAIAVTGAAIKNSIGGKQRD